jgi:hypothetical protein
MDDVMTMTTTSMADNSNSLSMAQAGTEGARTKTKTPTEAETARREATGKADARMTTTISMEDNSSKSIVPAGMEVEDETMKTRATEGDSQDMVVGVKRKVAMAPAAMVVSRAMAVGVETVREAMDNSKGTERSSRYERGDDDDNQGYGRRRDDDSEYSRY